MNPMNIGDLSQDDGSMGGILARSMKRQQEMAQQKLADLRNPLFGYDTAIPKTQRRSAAASLKRAIAAQQQAELTEARNPRNTRVISCPRCHGFGDITEEMVGKWVLCSGCSLTFEIAAIFSTPSTSSSEVLTDQPNSSQPNALS